MFLNRVLLIGRIGKINARSIETNGKERAVVDVNLAVDRDYKDDDGNRPTDWIRVQAFGPLAETLEAYGKPGRLIAVEGQLRTSQYTREVEVDGYDDLIVEVPTISVSIHADTVRFLDHAANAAPEEETSARTVKGRVVASSAKKTAGAKAASTTRTTRTSRRKAAGAEDDVPF